MEQYLIYLRKSRADRDAENRDGGDTLERHRTALLELAGRMSLSVAGIYQEIVSGETIAARPEMRKLLRQVETGAYAGVLVMEVERLARGNTRDQGIVAETFQYSGTKIVTPAKIYDPADESDQEYFEFGLFMSRREYKTINRRLQRGRDASLREGKYIAGTAPYGYARVKLSGQKGYTLEIVPDKAQVVRRIYSLYIHGERRADGSLRQCGAYTIAGLLDAEGIPSPGGGRWQPGTVRDMLMNPTYAGMLRWSYRPTVRRMEAGQRITTRPVNREAEYRQGLHPPIIARADWDIAQAILAGRAHVPLPEKRRIRNPLAGLVYCAACGQSMERRTGNRGRDMLLCPNRDCNCKSSVLEEVERGVLDALGCWLAGYRLESLPAFRENDPAEALRAREDTVARLNANLSVLQAQQDRLCSLLEQGVYPPGMFRERSRVLAERSAQAGAALKEARQQLQAERILAGSSPAPLSGDGHVLDQYSGLETAEDKNDFLKRILQRVEYTKTSGGRWTDSDLRLAVFPKIR